MVFGGRFRIRRCNSKASYLPRQSLEKLNNADPDHGSYKLTLNSNEDLVAAHPKPASTYDILTHNNGKLPNNLPDVLPLDAKLQSQSQVQPSSPTTINSVPLRYGSNNNLPGANNNAAYPMYPTQHRYSTPTMSGYNSNSNTNTNSNNNNSPNNNSNQSNVPTGYSRSQSYDAHNHNHSHNNNSINNNSSNNTYGSPTKFMSQSTIDLKRSHQLEPTLEETTPMLGDCPQSLLSPAQSENNLSSPGKQQQHHPTAMKPLSATDAGGSEGRLFRAELVNATLSTSPVAPAKSVARKNSLRENIEKISQLQSKLMSAQLSDSGFGSKTALNTAPTTPTTPTTAPQMPLAPQTRAQVDKNAADASSDMKITAAQSDKRKDIEPLALGSNTSLASNTDCSSNNSEMGKAAATAPRSPTPSNLSSASTASLPQTATNSTPHNSSASHDDAVAAEISQTMDSSIDGLKLMQRSELVLRVNPSTNEAASQTDDALTNTTDGEDLTRVSEQQRDKEDAQQRITLQPRQRHPIELDCEKMSQELATLVASNEKLVQILTPPMHKSAADYVSNLYNPNVPLRPAKRDVGTSTLLRMKTRDGQEASGGAQKLTVELQYAEVEVLLSNGGESETCDLLKNKVDELIKQLNRKIRILNKQQTSLQAESALNDELGGNLVNKLTDKVRPLEATKCRTYIEDVGQITSLLLSLSERLARAENTLSTITAENSADKKSLELKRDRLYEQLAEAKRLKEDIDRRGSSVVGILEKTLNADEFADFDYFINMKAKLIADARDIADKIKCGEEQLNALSEALIQSDC